jgi:hypothetical protein
LEIYLNNDIIDDMQISDEELCVYIALKSIYQSSRNKQYITYNMILYELVGNFSFKRSLYKKVKSAFESLVNKNLILIDNKVSASEFIVNLSGLYFTSDFTTGKGKYYTIVYSDEVQAILNLDNKIDKLKLLRYFVVCMRTINKTKGIYKDTFTAKTDYVGFMSQEYLCQKSRIDGNTLLNYNKILVSNKLLYVYKHTELKRDINTGQFKSFSNHYGRYEDKEDIIVFAKNYEKTCGITEKIVQSEKANVKRSISAKYNNLRWHFDRYSKQYSNNELIEIYKQIHYDNELINKEIKGAIPGSDYQKKLMKKLRDEEIFNDIPCIVDYIEKKKSTAIISRNNNYNEDIWGEPDAVGL